MHPLHVLFCFLGGALLMNAVPHLGSGVAGRRFPSPFATPPGRGPSSPSVNVLWGLGNLVAAYLLLCKAARFDPDDAVQAGALALGMLLLGLGLARHFGALHEGVHDGVRRGGGPDRA